jgi:hypothetical protein
MGKLNPGRVLSLLPLNTVLRSVRRWRKRWEPNLDRLEDFATNLGVGHKERLLAYARRQDGGFFACAVGVIALLLLALT